MKKILLSSTFLFLLFALMQSCQKEVADKEVVKEFTVDASISSGTDYLLKLAPYGDDGDVATILEKGDHASISQLEEETDMFTYVYHYRPEAKTQGVDHITLSIKQNGRANCKKDCDSTLVYINLTIK